MLEDFEKFLIEQLGFDQHPTDPCLFILRALESLERGARRGVGDPFWRRWSSGKSVWNLGVRSWLEQQSGSSVVQSQKTYATDVKKAKTRRNAEPDDCATPFEIRNHLSTTRQGPKLNTLVSPAAMDVHPCFSLCDVHSNGDYGAMFLH